MRQQSFASGSFEKYRKATRKEKFLNDMDQIIPWKELTALIAPFYPKPKGAGRRPVGIERMLRIYFLQHWFQLSDPGAEEALYDTRSLREFVGIDLGQEPVPDESTILNFRHLLEQHNLGDGLFHCVNAYLEENGMKVARGTIVDATIINAPSSTKNKDKARDPEMHQTKKGNQWYFGMKAHISVDSKNKLIHSVAATAANVHDSQVLEDLLHGEETRVYGDSAYANQKAVLKAHAPDAKDFTNQKGARNNPLTTTDKSKNTTKSRTRARVEHLFHTLKCRFGYTKVRYRGLNKNANHLFAACALVNLVTAKKHLLRAT
jgi:IS5 family transposase